MHLKKLFGRKPGSLSKWEENIKTSNQKQEPKKKTGVAALCQCYSSLPIFSQEIHEAVMDVAANIKEEMEDSPLRLPKPVIALIRNTEEIFDKQWFRNLIPFMVKLVEWTVVFCLGVWGFGYGSLLFLFTVYAIKVQGDILSTKDTLFGEMTNEEFMSKVPPESLPLWISSSNSCEKVDWINDILEQVWSHIGQYATPFIKTFIEPGIKDILNDMQLKDLSGFDLKRVVLGSIPLKMGGMKVFPKRHKNHKVESVVLETELIYAGDARVLFQLQKVSAEIKNIKFRGLARIHLKPLLNTFPIIGGFEITFIKQPVINYSLGGLGTFAEIPGINSLVKSIVESQIKSRFVWPNKFRLTLPIKDDPKISPATKKNTSCLLPLGLLNVHIIEAEDLVAKDLKLRGKSTSDPYAVVAVNGEEISFQSQYVDKSLNPLWNYECKFILDGDLVPEDHCLEIRVYDYDHGTQDDFMGKVCINLEEVISDREVDLWYDLCDTKKGRIHVKLSFKECSLNLIPSEDYILSVYINSCKNLLNSKDQTPSSPVKCVVNGRRNFIQKCKASEQKVHVIEEGALMLTKSGSYFTIDVIDGKNSSEIYGRVKIAVDKILSSTNWEINNQEIHMNYTTSASIHLSAKLYSIT
ncbi:extended synaptotagmin-2-A isoform X2 [Lepeophtheirus salmonis]|uniref:extended synaptotagmin-2-A isoform X2 n=1 Tax=Lepeophtheirus salmonis TaxID=72036 RepID=UPI001AE929D1|nr:extended synaptotagmin-1-like isoform X2 [Lepeophtheirus salmonis]